MTPHYRHEQPSRSGEPTCLDIQRLIVAEFHSAELAARIGRRWRSLHTKLGGRMSLLAMAIEVAGRHDRQERLMRPLPYILALAEVFHREDRPVEPRHATATPAPEVIPFVPGAPSPEPHVAMVAPDPYAKSRKPRARPPASRDGVNEPRRS